MECTKEKNKSKCPCTYSSCDKKGHCCSCVQYHRKKNQLPGCYFSPEAEKTYDRSIQNFIKTNMNKI